LIELTHRLFEAPDYTTRIRVDKRIDLFRFGTSQMTD
jgi:hypothetical protein